MFSLSQAENKYANINNEIKELGIREIAWNQIMNACNYQVINERHSKTQNTHVAQNIMSNNLERTNSGWT